MDSKSTLTEQIEEFGKLIAERTTQLRKGSLSASEYEEVDRSVARALKLLIQILHLRQDSSLPTVQYHTDDVVVDGSNKVGSPNTESDRLSNAVDQSLQCAQATELAPLTRALAFRVFVLLWKREDSWLAEECSRTKHSSIFFVDLASTAVDVVCCCLDPTPSTTLKKCVAESVREDTVVQGIEAVLELLDTMSTSCLDVEKLNLLCETMAGSVTLREALHNVLHSSAMAQESSTATTTVKPTASYALRLLEALVRSSMQCNGATTFQSRSKLLVSLMELLPHEFLLRCVSPLLARVATVVEAAKLLFYALELSHIQPSPREESPSLEKQLCADGVPFTLMSMLVSAFRLREKKLDHRHGRSSGSSIEVIVLLLVSLMLDTEEECTENVYEQMQNCNSYQSMFAPTQAKSEFGADFLNWLALSLCRIHFRRMSLLANTAASMHVQLGAILLVSQEIEESLEEIEPVYGQYALDKDTCAGYSVLVTPLSLPDEAGVAQRENDCLHSIAMCLTNEESWAVQEEVAAYCHFYRQQQPAFLDPTKGTASRKDFGSLSTELHRSDPRLVTKASPLFSSDLSFFLLAQGETARKHSPTRMKASMLMSIAAVGATINLRRIVSEPQQALTSPSPLKNKAGVVTKRPPMSFSPPNEHSPYDHNACPKHYRPPSPPVRSSVNAAMTTFAAEPIVHFGHVKDAAVQVDVVVDLGLHDPVQAKLDETVKRLNESMLELAGVQSQRDQLLECVASLRSELRLNESSIVEPLMDELASTRRKLAEREEENRYAKKAISMLEDECVKSAAVIRSQAEMIKKLSMRVQLDDL